MGKAQTMIFEQVLLFLISVSIFIACFFLFQLYQSHYSFIALNDHVKAVRDLVSSHVLELARFGEVNSTVKIRIPKKISGEEYKIVIAGSIVNVTTDVSRTAASLNLSLLIGGYVFSGNSTSSKGEIIIYKSGNNIILG